jgi:chromosome segregation ATPase
MSGKNSIDLGDLQRERKKRESALSEISGKIAAIEAEERRKREEVERRQSELAKLEKKLGACRENISWFEGKIGQFKAIAEAQIDAACNGNMEGFLNLTATLNEIAAWELAVEAFKKYERSLPEKIAELGG